MTYTNRRYVTDGSEARAVPSGEQTRVTRRAAQSQKKKTPITVIGVAMVLGLVLVMVLQLFASQRLYESKSQVAALQTQLDELMEQQGKLRSEYESKIDFAAIEAQATRLGMAKPTGTESIYINLSGEDRGEVLTPSTTMLTALSRLTDDAFTNLAAYLAQPES